MAHILTKLRIDEVSCVLKAANQGARVLIRKSDRPDRWDTPQDTPYLFDDIMLAKADVSNELRGDRDNRLTAKLKEFAALMVTVDPSKSEEKHLFDFVNTAHGRKRAEHLNNLSKGETIMPQVDIMKLQNIDSVVEIAKNIIDGKTDMDGLTYDQVLIGHAKQSKRTLESILTDQAHPEIQEA